MNDEEIGLCLAKRARRLEYHKRVAGIFALEGGKGVRGGEWFSTCEGHLHRQDVGAWHVLPEHRAETPGMGSPNTAS